MRQLKDNIYYVGVSHPSLRVFDIIMSTEFGTTYNAYLIKSEKTALVESVHDEFSEFYFENISSVTDISKIDYIIFNHTEPDHSGSLSKLLEINPNLTVVGTAVAIKNLKSITNLEFNSMAVKTSDSIDLGNGEVIEFFQAPNLHWPDSMFSYLKSQKAVFTCDFLGSHFCEPDIDDTRILEVNKYWDSFEVYFNAIMGPFKPFVLKGLDILNKLDFDMVCTSHGPVLKSNIKTAMEKYKEWSTPVSLEKTASVFYVSAYGYTKKMADFLCEKLNENGIKTTCYNLIEHSADEIATALHSSNALLFGSPTFNKNAVPNIWSTFAMIDAVASRNKPAMMFGSYGWSGEACAMMASHAKSIGLKVYENSVKCVFNPSQSDFDTLEKEVTQFATMI